MAAAQLYEGVKRAETTILNNASGTTLTSAIFTPGGSGSRIYVIRFTTGPTTAPGAGVQCAVVHFDGTNNTTIDIVNITDAVNTVLSPLVYNTNKFLFLPSGDSLKFQMLTALASGATLHIEISGCDY